MYPQEGNAFVGTFCRLDVQVFAGKGEMQDVLACEEMADDFV
jgi:hypothetical protein